MLIGRRWLLLGGTGLFGATTVAAEPSDEPKTHGLVIQISTNDAAVMNLGLNNAVNVAEEYSEKGEDVEIEIVCYGPGLHLLRGDTSPLKDRVASIAKSMPYVTFIACGNTQATMAKNEGRDIVLVPQAKVVKAGVGRIMELQERHWSYIRP